MEPPEFEDVVRQVRPGAERNPLSLMREFPLDDVQVETVRRKMRTVSPIINENECVAELLYHGLFLFSCFFVINL